MEVATARFAVARCRTHGDDQRAATGRRTWFDALSGVPPTTTAPWKVRCGTLSKTRSRTTCRQNRASFPALAARLRRETEGHAQTPSEVLIREDRESGHRRYTPIRTLPLEAMRGGISNDSERQAMEADPTLACSSDRPNRFDRLFAKATPHSPHEYQKLLACGERRERHYDEWLSGSSKCESMLIDVPTGFGKTGAVVLAWLWNRVMKPPGRLAAPPRLLPAHANTRRTDPAECKAMVEETRALG